ncbi:phage integrase N-terminal SAM-like domain-containing protein [Zobellella denitrificans]|uniref:phage integrase N-terminal SAM-like domain-containing protein n=1 Tax=Zobellella denitrificans TaxID=347534 RepID=UPI000BBE5701|nr:phage integrase N-terminal SAM-like domain-containing protein [Zobellella denitrificans]
MLQEAESVHGDHLSLKRQHRITADIDRQSDPSQSRYFFKKCALRCTTWLSVFKFLTPRRPCPIRFFHDLALIQLRTEKSYLYWIKGYILFHRKQHPDNMGVEEVKSFLSWLANDRHVAVNTQKQALCALVFLYQQILHKPLGELDFVRTSRQRYLPTVLTREEIQRVLQHVQGKTALIIQLLYGCGLRIIYTHVLGQHYAGTLSPLDTLPP